jgi:hypothetical protein
MKLNLTKTKFMLFNPAKNWDFIPNFTLGNTEIETQEEMKMLGIIVRNDLTCKSNTDTMTQKAYSRLWILKRLKKQGANLEDLKDIYIKQVRSVLEFGVPVWSSGLKQEEVVNIERVQKSFLHIAIGGTYVDYKSALEKTDLETLSIRRTKLCSKFAVKTAKHPVHNHWFVKSQPGPNTRSDKPKFKPPLCRLNRLKTSPIPYLTSLLNSSK